MGRSVEIASQLLSGQAPLRYSLDPRTAREGEVRSWSGADYPGSLSFLVDRLEEVRSLRDPASRRLCLDLLVEHLGVSLVVEDFAATRTHLFAIVHACRRQHPHALRALIDVVEQMEPGSIPVRRARAAIDDMAALELVTEPDRDELLALLSGLPHDLLAEFVCLVAGRRVELRSDDEYHADALVALEQMNARPDGVPPLLVFVEHLAAHLDDHRAERLRRWNDRQAEKGGLTDRLQAVQLEQASRPRPAPDPVAYLVVRIEPDLLSSDQFVVVHWQHNDPSGWRPQRGKQFVGDLDEVRAHTAELVATAETSWARNASNIVVEFLLPYSLLNLPVDQWDLEVGSMLPRPLGLHYQVVVRSLDRARSPRWHREWRRRWELLRKAQTELTSFDDHWLWSEGAKPRQLTALDARLAARRDVVCLVLRSVPDGSEPGEIMIGLRTGVPVIVWQRSESNRSAFDAEIKAMRDRLPWLVESLRLLRGRAKQVSRPESHVGGRISLLWDDPERPVEPLDPPAAPIEEVATG